MKEPEKNKDTGKALTPEEYDRQEAIRLAREGGAGEATPPDMGTTTHKERAGGGIVEDFDSTHIPTTGGSLEDRDTNDGDANSENN